MYKATNHRSDEQVNHNNYELLLRYLYETGVTGDTYTIEGPDHREDIMLLAAGVVKLDWIYINA